MRTNKILFLPIFLKNKFFIRKTNNNIVFNISYKNKYLNIFNSKNISEVYFNKNNNLLIIKNYKLVNNFENINNFIKFLFFWKYFLFTKIKFKGKGYKIIYNKKKKNMKFFFNTSHLNLIMFNKIILKKIIKNKFIILNKINIVNKNLSRLILSIRKINLYTLRGLRSSKQIIYKRKGKKSSYI